MDAELLETHEGFMDARARMEGKIETLLLLIRKNATARDNEVAELASKVEEETARADQWYRDLRIEEQVGHHQADQIDALESEMQLLQGEKCELATKVENLVEQGVVGKAELEQCRLLLSKEATKCEKAESSLVLEQQEGNAMRVYITELQAKLASQGQFEELRQRAAHMDERQLELSRVVETCLVEIDGIKEQLHNAKIHCKERLDGLAKAARCKIEEEKFCAKAIVDREREQNSRDELLTRFLCLYPVVVMWPLLQGDGLAQQQPPAYDCPV